MSYFGITGKGPTFEHPLVEENHERCLRPVVIKNRKVKGKRGWLLRHVGRYIAPDPSPEGLGHKALMVGSYLHELHTDEANQKYLVAQRLSGSQIWVSTIGESVRGYTDLTDQEIADQAMRVQSWMRGRERGKYDVRKNNCHHFVNELLHRICVEPKLASDDESLKGSVWSGSTMTLETSSSQDVHEVTVTLECEKGLVLEPLSRE